MRTYELTDPFVDNLGGNLQDRVRRAIERDIASGRFSAGDRLPAERDIAKALDVSLAPVRAALEQLAQRSVIVRRQGKGTFVAQQRVQYRLESWHSCTEDLRNQGIAFEVKVLALRDETVPDDVAASLDIQLGEAALHVVRLITISRTPAIMMDSWTRGVAAASVGDEDWFEAGGSLYRALANRGIELTSVDTSIEVSFTGEAESALFGVAYATPLLQVGGVARCSDGPREWSRLKYLSEMFSLNIHRNIDRPSPAPTNR